MKTVTPTILALILTVAAAGDAGAQSASFGPGECQPPCVATPAV